jgi:hypothetical protein
MIEDSIGTAINNFTNADPVLGGVIILLLGSNAVTARFLLGIIRELKADLVSEREDHQKTRTAQIEDLRNLGQVAKSVDALRDILMRKSG